MSHEDSEPLHIMEHEHQRHLMSLRASRAITASAIMTILLSWGIMFIMAFSGCGGGSDKTEVVSQPPANVDSRCAVEFNGDFYLCLDQFCGNKEPIEPVSATDEGIEVKSHIGKADINVSIPMCSSIDFQDDHSTHNTTTQTDVQLGSQN